ncbi:hypothetical protein FOA52_008330 [Chlamydomonas sp. UWO 241]|nr:hypothetical protein FOA52_008330 [Chlamydomonas sp. UWO 241]
MARTSLSLYLALAVALLGLASAAKDNGGLCSFPHCDCWTDFPSECLKVSPPIDVNNTYSFTIFSECDEPLGHKCDQTLYKLEFNTYVYCRWSKVTATYTWQGVTQPVPFAPVFDNAQSTTPCTDLQTLKITKLNIPYAFIKRSPLTFTLALDNVPGARRCTSWPELLNNTNTFAPYPMTFFSEDNKCCALPTPPPPPPPPGLLPLLPSLIEFCVVNPAGVANPTVPPYPTAATCTLLMAYADSMGSIMFSCMPVNITAAKTCVKVTGMGSLETNAVFDFPHACMPGNSAANGGVGEIASETAGFAFTLYLTNITANSYEVNIRPNPMCEASLSGRTDCCNTQFKKTEFVIGSQCRNAIAMVETPGPSIPKLPSYQTQSYPGTVPPSMLDNPTPLTAKIINLFSDAGQTTSFRLPINLGAAAGFAVLAGASVTSSSTVVAPTQIRGDLGVSPGTSVTGFPPGQMNGYSIHSADVASAAAMLDLTAAYNDAAGRVLCPVTIIGNLGGMTLTPGLYKSTSGMEVTGSDLTLDAQGVPNAIFIFQMATTFEMTTGMKIILAGGAQAKNIFWQVGSSGNLQASTVFEGTMMADQSITSGTGTTVHGRILARIASVTMQSADFSLP